MNVRLIAGALAASVAFGAAAAPLAAQPAAPAATPPADVQQLPPPPPAPVLPNVPNVAPGYAAPQQQTLPSGELVGVNQPFVGITLQDAITMALQRNTDLAISQSNARIANYQIVAAEGATDVQFQVVPSYSHGVQPAQSLLQSGPGGGPITQISDGISAAFTGQTALGTRYSLSASQSAIQNTSQVNSYNPFYDTAIALQLTQPLLRGAGAGSPVRRQIEVAKGQAQAQEAGLLAQASQAVTNVADAYWDLVAAWRNVAIQEEGLRNASSQASSTGRQAYRGTSAPVDVVESNAQVSVFQDNVFSALQRVQQLQTQLKSLILGNPADPLWLANLVPTSSVLQVPPEPKLDDLMASALRNRPEFKQLQAERLVADANLAFAKNQLLPQLDLGVGVAANGFAGIPQASSAPFFATIGQEITALNALIANYNATAPPGAQMPLLVPNFGSTPAYQSGGSGQSWRNAASFRFPTYNVSLTISIPLGNRTARADYAIAQEQAKQVAVQELALLQRLRADAVNAIQTLRETQYRLASASAARVAAQRVLVAEQRRFSAGTSTTFLVLQRQLEVANDEGRELQAQTDLNKAVAELNRVAGTNFATYGIEVKDTGEKTIDVVTPTRSVLPLPPDAQASPPPPHR